MPEFSGIFFLKKPNMTDPAHLIQQIKQALQANQIDLAQNRLNQLKTQFPNRVMALLLQAQIALIRGESSTQIPALEGLVQQKPDLAEAYYLLGLSYQQNRQLPKAAQALFQSVIFLSFSESIQVKPQSPTESLASNQSEQTLWQVLALLHAAKIPSFPTAGTLLGLEREGQILPNDKDLDIGLDWLQMQDAVALLCKNGWHEEQNSYGLINPRCLKNEQGLALDLCGYATEQATQRRISGLWMDGVPFDWNRITYFDAIDLIPQQSPAGLIGYLKHPEKVLLALYGEGWHTPDPNFDTIVCAKNLAKFSWLAQCYAYARLYSNLKRGQLARAQSIVQRILEFEANPPLLLQLNTKLQSLLNATKPKTALALGYFDLLHTGHLNYLKFAKQQADRLLVGVAPDAFCQISKGYSPVMDEQQRMTMVKALKVVDQVCLVGARMADTSAAIEWITQQGVQKVVCGQEWQHTERWLKLEDGLARNGIEVIYAPSTPSISTSQIKQKIQQPSRDKD
jgi:cytidyltransferase-like protein